MRIVLVHVHVKAERIDEFRELVLDNARHSVQEPGIARFDVIQQEEEPTRFILIEVYRDQAAATAHKETAHYLRWRDAVGDLLAEPRYGIWYENAFPDDDGW